MKNNELVPVGGKVNALYRRMQTAIAECYSIDDCRNIATQANAIAAYYSQIKDDESVRKFLQVKLRAWRRIGEILVAAKVDKSKCNTLGDGSFNMAEYIRRIRAVFKDRNEVEELSDGAFREAIKIAEVPADFFEKNVIKCNSISAIIGAFSSFQDRLWRESPEGQAVLKEQEKRAEVWRKEDQKRKQEEAKKVQEAEKLRQQKAKEQAEEDADIQALRNERQRAFDEVGITLDRRYRKEMKQVVFLIKDSIHETLRQAAFDNRVTMQSILRSGLMMWFIAHGYKVPMEDMNLPPQNRRDDASRDRGG